ncbi:MAG: glycosyltransferase family 4 protein, partial [bacterium]
MKIAFLQRDLPFEHYGGVACQVHLLANALCRLGHQVTVFSLSKEGPGALYKTIQIVLSPFIKKYRILHRHLLGFYFRKLNLKEFDAIHAHGDNYCMGFRKPLVRTFYGSALGEMLNASNLLRALSQFLFYILEWVSAPQASVNVGISSTTRSHLPFIKRIIPCGIQTCDYRPVQNKSNKPSILFVGEISGRKRGKLLLSVFRKEILPRMPECELHMICNEKAIGKNVYWHGKVSKKELFELYSKAWVTCIPSRYEGFGVPVLESMAWGTPIVATSCGGIDEILKDGDCGIITTTGELAHKLCRVIEDKKLYQELRRGGLE